MADINKALSTVRAEMPDQAGTSVEPMGWFGSVLAGLRDAIGGGQTQALTNPFTGSVSYDPQIASGLTQPDAEDMLTHELTHSRQAQGSSVFSTLKNAILGPSTSYGQDPAELEAFQAEQQRAVHQGRHPNPGPNFQGGGFRQHGDIELPALAGLKKASK